jgi:redox-sensitive bicupin YhaK (pirin superfamily)
MKHQIRRAADRGHANHGWLDTNHTFSFANYYDPKHMGFSHLRVINEDRVTAGRGFGPHPHRDMEIISYVVDGALAHRDSTGSGGVIRHGDVQTMSAGRGVFHEEMNGSKSEPVHFLQIWLLPAKNGTPPAYADKHFDLARRGMVLVASPDGRDGSLTIGQDTDLYRLLLDDGKTLMHDVRRSKAWIQVVQGELTVAGEVLKAGDGMALVDAEALELTAKGDVEALVFDLL